MEEAEGGSEECAEAADDRSQDELDTVKAEPQSQLPSSSADAAPAEPDPALFKVRFDREHNNAYRFLAQEVYSTFKDSRIEWAYKIDRISNGNYAFAFFSTGPPVQLDFKWQAFQELDEKPRDNKFWHAKVGETTYIVELKRCHQLLVRLTQKSPGMPRAKQMCMVVVSSFGPIESESALLALE